MMLTAYLCQIDGENNKLRRQSSEFSDGNTVIYDCYLRCHFWMTPYVHNTVYIPHYIYKFWIISYILNHMLDESYIQCAYDIFGRAITNDTVIYGVYTRFWLTLLIQCVCTISLAGKLPVIRSCTVYICSYGQPYLYSVRTISLAGKLPVIRSCTVWCIYAVLANPTYTVCVRYLWQGNHKWYGHIQCIYAVLANPTYTVCVRYLWQGNHQWYGHVLCGVYMRFWPTLLVCLGLNSFWSHYCCTNLRICLKMWPKQSASPSWL